MKATEIESGFGLAGLSIKSYSTASEDELMMVLNWRNDPAIRSVMFTTNEIAVEDHFSFARGLADKENCFYFIVYQAEEPIGAISLTDVDYNNNISYLGIYGRPDKDVDNVGCLLMHSISHIVFDILKLNSLKLQVLHSNERAYRFYKKYGFVEEGRLCEAYLRGEKYEDVIIMGILAREYKEMYG